MIEFGMGWHDRGHMDMFFNQLTDCFVQILEKGLVAFDESAVSFENSNVDLIFKCGMECLHCGFHPVTTTAVLESKILFLALQAPCSEEVLLELNLLKQIILTFQNRDIETFGVLNHQLGSTADASYNDMKLEAAKASR